MLFNYKAVDEQGADRSGQIDAVNIDVAIASLQRRGLIIASIDPVEQKVSLGMNIQLFSGIKGSDIVMLSRQMTTLFEAQVSALRAFQLLAAEARTPQLAAKLSAIAGDIQAGAAISAGWAGRPWGIRSIKAANASSLSK